MVRTAKLPADESLPEIDRVEAMPHPREVIDFTGNSQAEQALLNGLKSGRLHHAWLLSGPQGVGKATLAYRFARFLLSPVTSENLKGAIDLAVSRDDPAFRQVAAQSHPGLLVLRRPWQARTKRHAKAITIDEARRLRSFFGQTAAGGAWRVVIIDSADELNISAANAVLKSLEEPPAACVFLLISSAPGRLPVTIRSRCRILRLGPLNEDETRFVTETSLGSAEESVPDTQTLEECIALAQGSPGAALRLLAGGGIDLHKQILAVFNSMPHTDYDLVHNLADSVSGVGADERYALFHAMLSDLVVRLVSHVAGSTQVPGGEAEIAARLISPGTLAQWAALWETLQREKAQADALNLDRKALVMKAFFQIEEASLLK